MYLPIRQQTAVRRFFPDSGISACAVKSETSERAYARNLRVTQTEIFKGVFVASKIELACGAEFKPVCLETNLTKYF